MKTGIGAWLLLACVALLPLGFTGCAVFQGRESAGQYASDRAITARVKSALIADPIVKAHEVDVTTFRGVVQLSGFVETQGEKDRAGQRASEAKGVLEVHNDLVVPTGR